MHNRPLFQPRSNNKRRQVVCFTALLFTQVVPAALQIYVTVKLTINCKSTSLWTTNKIPDVQPSISETYALCEIFLHGSKPSHFVGVTVSHDTRSSALCSKAFTISHMQLLGTTQCCTFAQYPSQLFYIVETYPRALRVLSLHPP